MEILDKIQAKPILVWELFLKVEFEMAISKSNDLSAPVPDKISWKLLIHIIKDESCLSSIINITNACINLGY